MTYYYTDTQGTVLATADEAGNVTSSLDYTPFGSPARGGASDQPGYVGAMHDGTSDFIYMQARYYDPLVGRFLSPDPAATEFNQYAYASNNPIAFRDPTGLYTCGGTQKQCEKFEKALSEIRSAASSKQTTDSSKGVLLNVLRAYGTKDDDTPVAISFNEGGSVGSTVSAADGSAKVNFDPVKVDEVIGPSGPGYDNGLEFASAVVHEGQHVSDGSQFDLGTRNGFEMSEKHAYRTQGLFNQAVRNISAWGLWRPGISPQQMIDAYSFQGDATAAKSCEKRQCK